MYNSTTIANYFINRFKDDNMTPMKVIKLTYLSYCWYLALTNGEGRLINEHLEAWDFGPVFPRLYNSLKKYGKTSIDESIPYQAKEDVDKDTSIFLDKMWDMYGKFSGVELSALTHKEDTPWQKVYCKGCNSQISDQDILTHYKGRLLTTKA